MADARQAAWIKECEDNFSQRFYSIAEDIITNRGLRIVRLYGPTCSGKTTAARILISLFEELGKKAHVISIDDFFYNTDYLLELSKKKGIDGLDYDSPDTIDYNELRRFADEIFESEEVHCPIFDFKLGRKDGYKTFSIDENDIFIFEGIQACYPSVKEMLSAHGSASVFIAPQSNVYSGGVEFVPNRLRLMRRLVRDYHFRASSPEFTLDLWKNVRENEIKNIFPYSEESDYKVDSSMAYEVGILKPYLESILANVPNESEHYDKAREILLSVKDVETISSELIHDGYLYSEFV
jgi:uridine kinase